MARSGRLVGAPKSMSWGSRAAAVARSSLEAALLAAVALGVAQAGWSFLSPGTAGASGAAPDGSGATDARTRAVESPFAPMAAAQVAPQQIETLLSGVQLNGLRTGFGDLPGSAILTLSDGQQHSVAVGQEAAPGVVLSEVAVSYVVFSSEGGSYRMQLPGASEPSLALSLMGLSAPASAAPGSGVLPRDAEGSL